MSDTSNLKRCPKCGQPIPEQAPQGLCPKCVLLQASIPTEGAKTRPAPSREEVAAAFPQLEILELIGQGGMGFVFKARQPKLERLVALKILPQALATDPAFAERFTREGRALARLNHPNIVAIHDFGQAGGFFYLLMEFVDGVNLRQAMRAGRFTPAQALAVVPKICEALQFAHNEGILHRDIKPENILLDAKGRVKIADFGIAKLVGETHAEAALTGSGATLGTPHYMAPEQLEKPGTVDHRADIYSLGVVFYEMLTGELPLGRFQPPSQKFEMDVRLDEVVLHALEKEPSRRYQQASQVKTAVETISGATAPAPSLPAPDRFWRLMAMAMAVLCLTLIAFMAWSARWFLARQSEARAQAASEALKAASMLNPPNSSPNSWPPPPSSDGREALHKAASMPNQPAHATDQESATLVIDTETYDQRRYSRTPHNPNMLLWKFKSLIPADHLAQLIFVLWSNGVPTIKPGFSGYLKIGPKPFVAEHPMISCEPLEALSLGGTNVVQWAVCPGFARTVSGLITNQPPLRKLETAPRSVLHSGRQLAIRLAEFVQPANSASSEWSGVEIRLILQPLQSPAVQTDPNEFVGADYVAGFGLAGASEDSILKLIKELPCESTADEKSAPSIKSQSALVPVGGREKESEKFEIATVTPRSTYGLLDWEFRYLIPADHLAQAVFLIWSNGVPAVEPNLSGYFKVGHMPVVFRDLDQINWSCGKHDSAPQGGSNPVTWEFKLCNGRFASGTLSNQPPYRRLETPRQSFLCSGRQLAIRLAQFDQPTGAADTEWSGIEIRWILQPLRSPAVQTDLNEKVGDGWVSGFGLAGASADSILRLIRELPCDPVASETSTDSPPTLLMDQAELSLGQMRHVQAGGFAWSFKTLVPANQLAQMFLVFWTNGTPRLPSASAAYVKIKREPVVFDTLFSCRPAKKPPIGGTNIVDWGFYIRGLNENTDRSWVSNQPPYRKLEIARSRLRLQSGHQLVIPLVECGPIAAAKSNGWSGVELRVLLKPLNGPAVITAPEEQEKTTYGGNDYPLLLRSRPGPDKTTYIGGLGIEGADSMEDALKMIEEMPEERVETTLTDLRLFPGGAN
jgi:serine/threonine protein kinase